MYNREHGITPRSVRAISEISEFLDGVEDLAAHAAALPGGSETRASRTSRS